MKKHYIIALFIFVMGVFLSVLTFYMLHNREVRKTHEEIATVANTYANAIQHNLEDCLEILYSLAAYNYASKHITQESFTKFAQAILQNHTTVESLQWIPERISKDQHYSYPVLYSATTLGSEESTNFDLASNPLSKEAILAAKDSEKIILTPPISTDDAKENKILAFYPIYTHTQEKRFLGCYALSIKSSELIGSAISIISKKCQGIDFSVLDPNAAQHSQEIFSSRCQIYNNKTTNIQAKSEIKLYGRTWVINCIATKAFTDKYATPTPLYILSLMLLFFSVLASTYFLIARRQFTLMQSNDELRRFQKVAIHREERIMELKQKLSECTNTTGSSK